MTGRNKVTDVATKDPAEIAMLQSVAELLDAIPDAGGDGSAFVLSILAAESAADLLGDDTGGEADDLEDMMGESIRIDTLTKATSDFEMQPGQVTDQFLICHGENLTRNTDVVFAVGATTPMVKLAKLNKFGVLPVVCQFSRAKKQTAQGYFPINLNVLSFSEPVEG